MKKFMHFLSRLFPETETGENPIAVKMFQKMTAVKEFFSRVSRKKKNWPVADGNYQVINPKGKIAVCTLTSENLDSTISHWEDIAIIGKVYTPNLGIEKIILNTITNPHIRYLLICGKDSLVFRPGQAIECLFTYGIDEERRIKNANGHFPVLKNLSQEKINCFLNQVELINCIDEKNVEELHQKIQSLSMNKKIFSSKSNSELSEKEEIFIEVKPGGKRIPLEYDEKGFFVITINHSQKEIIVKHYHKDNCPGYLVKGHSCEPILLALVENNLISQLGHAGYLGAELSKAETALKFGFTYIQDQTLKK